MNCGKCGHETKHGVKFCEACGESCSRKCSACGMDNDPDAKFCEQCGIAIAIVPPAGEPPAPIYESPDASTTKKSGLYRAVGAAIVAAVLVAIGFGIIYGFRSEAPTPVPPPPILAAAPAPTQKVTPAPQLSTPADKPAKASSLPAYVVQKPYYGMALTTDVNDQIKIGAVDVNGPAAQAGLAVGDLIVKIDGWPPHGKSDDLVKLMESGKAETGYRLTVRRSEIEAFGKLIPVMLAESEWIRRMDILKLSASAVAQERGFPTEQSPPPRLRARLGMRVQALPGGPGILVYSVERGGPGHEAGIRSSDILKSINGVTVDNASINGATYLTHSIEKLDVIGMIEDEKPIPVVIYRGGSTLGMTVQPQMIEDGLWRRIREAE